MKVIIILPTYNEKGNIEHVICTLEEDIFPLIKNHTMHILVADDTSPDGTANEVKTLMKKYKNLHLLVGPKHGLGAAYIRGMDYAINTLHADVLFEMDADGQHDPKKIPAFLKKIDEGYDMVIGTRYSEGGSIPSNWPPLRKVYSRIGNIAVRTILMRFSIHDWTGGYRALRKEVFLKEKEKLTSFKGYTFQVSFLHKAAQDGFKIAEVPFNFTDRTLGKSKIAPKEYIVDLLRYVTSARIQELKRFIKFLIVGGTGFIVQIASQELSVRIGLANSILLLVSPIVFAITKHHGTNALRDASAGAIGAEMAIISNFLCNNFWTFNDARKMKHKSRFLIRLIKFNMTSLLSIFIQAASIWIAVHILGDTLMLSSYKIPTRIIVVIPTIILLIIPLNYIIYNKIIWKTQYLKHGKTNKT